MIFVTFQPLKRDNRSKHYQGNLKPIYDSFCKKPIFATGYEGDLINFFADVILASPQLGEKLIVFEADKYTALNKVRWHRYINHFISPLEDIMKGRSVLDNRTFNVTKKEKECITHYEYVVDEKDAKKLFEVNLINEDGSLNYFCDKNLNDTEICKKIIDKCKNIVAPPITDFAINYYRDILNEYIENIFDSGPECFFSNESLESMLANIQDETEKKNVVDRNTYKIKLAYLRYSFIIMVLPFIMVAVLQKPCLLCTKLGPASTIDEIFEIKNKYMDILELLRSEKPLDKKEKIDAECKSANKKLDKLYSRAHKLFYTLSEKDIMEKNSFWDELASPYLA